MQNSTPLTPKSENNRIPYIDLLRVFACFLVIFYHSPMPTDDASLGKYLGIMSFIGSSSPDLFLSISGALLLPVNIGFKAFYKRRFLKIVPPVFFWSVIILFIYWVLGKIRLATAIEYFVFMPFIPAVGVYWFVYVLIGLYLVAPFISKWIETSTHRQFELFFFLWGVCLILPYLNLIFPGKFAFNGSHYWELNYFGGFLGYWLIGYYLRIYPIKIGANFRFTFLISGVLAYCMIVLYAKLFTNWHIPTIYDNLQAGSVFVVALLYTFAQNIKIKSKLLQDILADVAKMSFGIYLIHIVILRDVVWRFFANVDMHPLPETFAIAIISMAICYVIVKAISYMPGSKYLIGV